MTKRTVLKVSVCALLAALVCFKVGLFAPSLAQIKGTSIEETPLVDLAGHKHSFHELRGQATTIYFWATWCGPCRRHMSELASAQRSSAKQAPLPVAIDDDPQAVAETLQRVGYHGPVWVATDGDWLFLRRFAGNDKRAVPFIVELDAAGNILKAYYRE